MTDPHARAQSGPVLATVLVRDLVLDAAIGVYEHEKGRTQRVRINIELEAELPAPAGDELSEVVCYETVVTSVRALVAAGHVNLVETLAHRIASAGLEDPRVRAAHVRVEKLDVFPDTGAVGVEIELRRR